jgi:hypothetical protein
MVLYGVIWCYAYRKHVVMAHGCDHVGDDVGADVIIVLSLHLHNRKMVLCGAIQLMVLNQGRNVFVA